MHSCKWRLQLDGQTCQGLRTGDLLPAPCSLLVPREEACPLCAHCCFEISLRNGCRASLVQ